ncbi:MAG: mechanosensitive ion channel [Flavobacteriaceae bacterium]|nr:mechanosensitive ion channel [Flavobacteriaceae bacterium]
MEEVNALLNSKIFDGDNVSLSIKMVLILIVVFIITALVLKTLKRLVTRKLPEQDKLKFASIFSFTHYFIYVVVILITMDNIGVNVTAIFATSAALLVGVGLALQTFFQDIISGIFILIDQSVHVGDIIEIDEKVGRVVEIKLRTTRAVTIDNKVLVIPNHKYLTSILYNWTENGSKTRESVSVGVAYGSDVELVKTLLLQAANTHPNVLKQPEPIVLFMDFGANALSFKLVFTLDNSFEAVMPQSDLRFQINSLFKQHHISIPFPQTDVHIYKH